MCPRLIALPFFRRSFICSDADLALSARVPLACQFDVALKLIALKQAGVEPTMDNIMQPAPLPSLGEHSAKAASKTPCSRTHGRLPFRGVGPLGL